MQVRYIISVFRLADRLPNELQKRVKRFHKDEEGSISIAMVFLFPMLMWLTTYFENEMQVRYVYNQLQTVMDLATTGGATTGEAVLTTNNNGSGNGTLMCTIPDNPDNSRYSGYHVAVKLMKDNADTLPKGVRNQIFEAINANELQKFNDPDVRSSGIVEMAVTVKFKPSVPLFMNDYRLQLKSSAHCQAVPGTETGNVNWNGPKLNPAVGTIIGPSGKETYYNCKMDGVVDIMRRMGNNDQYWVRDDGVKMLGNYVMVAADLNIHPRGSHVPTSLGMAVVCDTGTFAYSNHTQLDIAVNWGGVAIC